MKLTILTTSLVFVLGATASVFARDEGRQGEHQQQVRPQRQQQRPAQQQQRPAQQQQRPAQQQQRPAQQQQRSAQQQQRARPDAQHQAPRAIPAQPARFQQPQRGPVNRARESHREDDRRGGHEHGRISNDHYAAHFGREHSFHVHRGDYDHRRFRYGGYAFGFIDPWPMAWGYSDDVYVEYDDGGYYMYNRFHPGMRISIDIL
jgi:hypothetical protein